jgi:DNA-binding beta-propeller fold protein YncE
MRPTSTLIATAAAATMASAPPTTAIGTQPIYEALDSTTGTLYVANSSDYTLSMIDTRACNIHDTSGCRRHWPTVSVGPFPFGVIVDEATHTVYATNFTAHEVTLFDATTCNARVTTGCTRRKTTVQVGAGPNEGIVDPTTGVVYVTDSNASSVSLIDGSACSATRPACKGQPFATVTTGGSAGGVKLDPSTHTVYVVNNGHVNQATLPGGNTVSVINGGTCVPSDPAGCKPLAAVRVGAAPTDLAIDPRTDTLYVTNTYDHTTQPDGTVSVVDGRNCNATDTAGCKQLRPPQVTVQSDPNEAWFDPATGLTWITNQKSDSVSVIDSRRCSAAAIARCQALKPPTMSAGKSPSDVLADPQTGTVYVVDQGTGTVTLLPER